MAFTPGGIFILAVCFTLHSCISARNPAGIATTNQNSATLIIDARDHEKVSGLVLKTSGDRLQLEVTLPETGAFHLKYDLFDFDGIILFSGEEWIASGSTINLSINPRELDRGGYLLRTVANSKTSFHSVVVR